MYLWQASGVCLLGHFQNLVWPGNSETSKELGQRGGHLGTLKNRLPLHPVADHLQLVQGVANRPPCLLAADLGGPLQQQRQDTELNVRDEPMGALWTPPAIGAVRGRGNNRLEDFPWLVRKIHRRYPPP